VSELLSDEALMDVAFAALDHGVDSIEHGGPLIPFVMTATGEDRALRRFVADDFRDAVEQARGSLPGTDADKVALAYEAFVTIGGERADAVIVEFFQRGDAHSGLLGQRFVPGTDARPLERIGNPAFLGEQDPLF
jgi:hypothetical protein